MSIIYTCMCMLALSATVGDAVLPVVLGAVTAVSAANQFLDLYNNVGQTLPTHRQCTIHIQNRCTSHRLTNPRMYIQSGSSSVALPHDIGPNMETTVQFVKTSHTATGAVGVFTYDLRDKSGNRPRTFALMFSVPYDFTFHKSWYAAGLWYHSKACDYDLYYQMYYDDERGWFHRRGGDGYITYRDQRYTIKASMTNTFTPTIVVTIYDNWTSK